MSADEKAEGCVSTAAGPAAPTATGGPKQPNAVNEEKKMHVSVGKEAPDFEASAFDKGGFSNVKLSDFRGKWVFLCFYPGDFTFV